MPRPEARRRHAGLLALVVAVVLTGCADDTSDGAGGALTAAAATAGLGRWDSH
jgi:outer membrane biogenesis lipoprotein LolB